MSHIRIYGSLLLSGIRIEIKRRSFRFFQDRLIKERVLKGIRNYKEANKFHPILESAPPGG